MPIEGLFLLLASIQDQTIVKGIRRNEIATIDKDCKKETIETLMCLRRSYGGELHEAECFATTHQMTPPTANKNIQTGATCLEKLVP